ncbi:MAG TPA: phospholipase D-like domain-containing protein [Blastocatellia bacterium]|nr:phospholipase D-like domain-containing protein [Blastocatellia bacterium]
MGIWSWFANRIDHFIHDPTDNVNNGLIANPFLVKQTPVADHYKIGGEFGEVEGTAQRTSIEFWAAHDQGLVHVGLETPDENQPSYALAAITNGLLRLVPQGQTFVVPRTDRHPSGKIEVSGPAYILESLDTAVDSFRAKLNGDIWIEGGLAPPNRPMPAVIVYENVEISNDLDELIKTWYRLEKKLPFWTETRVNELVASWKLGGSTAYVKAGYPIGQPAATLPAGVVRPAGVPAEARYVAITVYDEFGVPIDLGWLLRHADTHAENEIFDNLVVPNVEIFRKDPVRAKLTRRDVIDLRDEYGLPYRNRSFRRFNEADFPPLTSVFDKDEADLVLATEPDTTGPEGIWLGPEVSAGNAVVIQGVGLKDHLLAFLPSCSSSSVAIKLRGYPGDYHRIIALPLNKWFPEQPNARPEHALKRFHLGCRVTPLIDGQSMLAAAADALRATYERGESDPPSPVNLRPPEDRADSCVWLCNWQISPATYPYGGSAALYEALDPVTHPELAQQLEQGLHPYPPGSLGFYLQSAIAAGVDVRLMPWYAIFGQTVRDQNIEIARSINRFYDLNGYHTPNGPGSDAQRAPHTAAGPDRSRGFAFVDDVTRSEGSHPQKVSFIRNRYGDFAFVGGIDMLPSRWDTNMHLSPEERKAKISAVAEEIAGWHDVHAMLEGPVVLDVAKNFFQRWNAFVADPPDDLEEYPVDLSGITPIQALPNVPDEGVPDWPGPDSELAFDAPIDAHVTLDRGGEGRRTRRATQVCAIVRTIPPFIDAYNTFVKARPVPDDGEPIGELGCRASYMQALQNARHYIYLEDQYFVEPEFVNLLIARLTDPDPGQRLRRLFVVVPHVLADQDVVDAIYHHFRRQHLLLIRQAVRNRLAADRSIDPATVPQEDIDKIFTLAHLQHPSGSEIYLHAKHMIVDDIWMVISSSNFSRRGMTYETEMGVTISDAEVEDGVRKSVRDHRIRLWAEHLRLDRSQWYRLLDPIAGAELLRRAVDNPNLPLIPFEMENDQIEFSYPAENHSADHELVYKFLADPDGRLATDPINVELARQALALLMS